MSYHVISEPSTERVRVFLVDDHPVVRSGLRALVGAQPDMEVVGEAVDGVMAVEQATTCRPDVVVMDLSMPRLGGAEATEQVKAAMPDVKVLALTAHEERGWVSLLLAAGASGYVLKRAASDDLVRAIRALAVGGMYLDPRVAPQVLATTSSGAAAAPRLSDREAEVLRLVAEGHAMKEIAVQLAISPRTLETYRARAMEKLGLKHRVDIVRYAVQRGWLTSG